MFTQIGLNNLWNELSTGKFLLNSDIQIVCDSATERCMKIFLHFERRYAHFSSKRSTHQSNNKFSIWVRSTHWQPENFRSSQTEEFYSEQPKEFYSKQDQPVAH